MRLTVYVRAACHLCDDMLRALQRYQAQLGFQLQAVDVDADPGLARRYGERIPVLMAGETELCHYFLDETALLRHFGRGAE